MSEPDHPVFVDPSGRRRQLVRVLAVLGAVLVTGYVVLVLVAAVGGPDSPAARLPLLPEHPPAANPQPGVQPLTVPPTAPTGATEPGTTITQPQPSTTASVPAGAPPAPPAVTSSRPSRGSRPSEPPGNGGPHTSPPGNGG